jgi:hypothetical protein
MFFKKLFDTKFENFVTRDVARVLYIFMIALLAIGLLVSVVFGFLLLTGDGYPELGVLMILGSPLLQSLLGNVACCSWDKPRLP